MLYCGEWNFNANYYYNKIDAVIKEPSYTYSSDGGYSVSLKVTNADGCAASTYKYISITRPNVSIATTGNKTSCGPVKLSFTANTTENIIAYNWSFSDGVSSTDAAPEHTFIATGSYFVTLTYTTKSGCTGTVSEGSINVYGKPSADFTASSTTICGNTPVSFNAVQTGQGISYFWDFGDGSSFYNYQLGNTSHQYNYDSTYPVTLIVANAGNCRDTVTKKDYVKILPPFPQINVPANTCDGTRGLVTFTQASRKAETYTWNFGDGATAYFTSNPPSVSHMYTKTGTYNTVLTVTNGQCTLSVGIGTPVLLKQNPVFSINPSEICSGSSFNFQITNIEASPAQVYYQNSYNYVKWQYDNGKRFLMETTAIIIIMIIGLPTHLVRQLHTAMSLLTSGLFLKVGLVATILPTSFL